MLKRVSVAILLMCAISCAVFAGDLSAVAEKKLALLNAIAQPKPLDWRYQTGDIADAASPSLDDSSWQQQTASLFQNAEVPVWWLRTKITIPESIGGVKIAGSKVTFTCGIDDDGVLYVDGKEAQKFHWDGGSVVLTENAKPGETYVVAIKAINIGGPARLLCSNVTYSALDSTTNAVSTLLSAYSRARTIYDASDATRRAPYLPIMDGALEKLDTDAIAAGNVEAFAASINAAQQELKRTGELAKGINIDLVGHAHIDMNWLWLWPETLDVCKNTFTTMIRLMDEYPDYRFNQSQARVYQAMSEVSPDLYAKIKDKVKAGQWDVSTAAMWVEGDMNMPCGESIVRQLLYGKRYIMQQFGIEPVVCWEPDTFGHAWTVPQILVKSGIKYYYHMRTGPGYPVSWWQSPDGSRVLAVHGADYNGTIDGNGMLNRALDETKRSGIQDYMHVYGVGDHGGGPTQAMLDAAVSLQKQDDYPTVRFQKAIDVFEKMSKSGASFPVWDNEMNFIFRGCYTSHADAKRWNRECENALASSETFSAIASSAKRPYPVKDYLQSWRKTCFNQFHDIIDGSAIHGSYDFSRNLRDEVVKQADVARESALSAIAADIDTRGKGVPIIVFNPMSWIRDDVVIVASPFPGPYAKVVDEAGKAYPARIADGKLCFTAHGVPAVGYRVFWVVPAKAPAAGGVKADSTTIENQFFRVRVDPATGTISSIVDKSTGREIVEKSASLLQILLEGDHGGNAWDIAPYTGSQDLITPRGVSLVENTAAKATIAVTHNYDKSEFRQDISVYDDIPRIDIHLRADWQQVCENKPTPLLKLAFQTNLKDPKATFEIPFGSIERPTDGSEVPGQKWIDLSQSDYGLSLLNDCKYGFDVKGNVMRATVLRASSNPDPIPDKGVHEVTYSLYPHKGDWRSAGTVRKGYELNEPLIGKVATVHKGKLASKRSYVSFSAPSVVMTALKGAEDDNSLVIRFYETNGQPCKTTVKLNMPAKAVVETDMLERPIGNPISLSGGQFTTNLGKCEIKTYKILR